jgi:hypothetical protein
MEYEPRSTSSSAASSAGLRLVPAKHVVTAVHGTRTVLLDPRRGRYYGLDEVGGRVWALIKEGLTVAEMLERLGQEYNVEANELEADVNELVHALKSKQLLEDT